MTESAPYEGPLTTLAAIEARTAEGRARLRARLQAVRAEKPDHSDATEPPPGFGAVIAAMFGPGEVVDAWRRWRAPSAPAGALERLERGVEDAQREVSTLALKLDALTAHERAVRAELDALRRDVEMLARNARCADDRARALTARLGAIELEQLRVLPTAGAALGAESDAVAVERDAARAEERMYASGAERLAQVSSFGAEVAGWCAQQRAALERVFADGSAVLMDLDARLGGLAAEARAADLGASLATNLETLHGAITRVHVQSERGAEDLVERLDRLMEAPDLLAPADPSRRRAEAEVDAALAARRKG